MIRSHDSATSSAIAFILLITTLILVAGVWAAVVLPNQLHEAEEQSTREAITALTDTRLLMRAVADSPYLGISIYSPLPKGSLITRDSGALSVNGEQIPIHSLVLLPNGDAELGITANGIWRKDGVSAGWVLFPQTSYSSNHLTLEILTFSGSLAYGSTEPIPFHFSFEESSHRTISDSVISMTFVSEDLWMQNIWQTVFQELTYTYPNRLNMEIVDDTLYLSAKSGVLTLDITEYVYSVNVGDVV